MAQLFKSIYLNPHINYIYIVQIHSSETIQEFHKSAFSIEYIMSLGIT